MKYLVRTKTKDFCILILPKFDAFDLFFSSYKLNGIDVPKHASSSHAVVSEESPAQVDPPLDGSGESHSLLLVCEPAPHVTLQSS